MIRLNELRELSVTCSGNSVFTDCRICVRGRVNMTLLPDFFMIDVYNPSEADIGYVMDNKSITVFTEKTAVLARGDVEDVYSRRDGVNNIYSLSLSDGQAFWETKVKKTLGKGVYFSSTIRQILQNATLGSYLAADNRFLRPQTFNGRLADIVHDIAKGVNARAFISHDVLHIVEKGRSEIVITIQEDDLLEEPRFATGVCVVKTRIVSWPVGIIASFRGKYYRIATQAIDADNYFGAWQTELTLVDEEYLDKDGMDGG